MARIKCGNNIVPFIKWLEFIQLTLSWLGKQPFYIQSKFLISFSYKVTVYSSSKVNFSSK